jgi:hypothetical protein
MVSACLRQGNGCATASKKNKKKSKSAVLTAQDIDDTKSWSTANDQSCEKYYYYCKGTKEISWDMPLRYHETHGGRTKDIAGSKDKIGLMSLGRKAASAKKETNDASPGPNADGNHNQAKYWRAKLDGTINLKDGQSPTPDHQSRSHSRCLMGLGR